MVIDGVSSKNNDIEVEKTGRGITGKIVECPNKPRPLDDQTPNH